MTKKKVTLAVIGLGWITREVWLPLFDAHPEIQTVGVYDVIDSYFNFVLNKYAGIKICQSISDIILMQPDLVLIATPNKFHIEYAEMLLKQNISVWIEKPICLSLQEYSRLKFAFDKSDAIFIPSAASKFREDVHALSKLLEENKCGSIRSMRLEWIRSSGIPNPGSWFTNKNLSGGGVGFDLGWHMLDVGFSLLNYPDINLALATTTSNFMRKRYGSTALWRNDPLPKENLPAEVEDRFIGFIVTKNNVSINLNLAWASHEPYDCTNLFVECENAVLELKTTFGFSPNRIKHPTLSILKNGEKNFIKLNDVDIGSEYQKQIEYVIKILEDKHAASVNLDNVYPIIKSLEMMYAPTE